MSNHAYAKLCEQCEGVTPPQENPSSGTGTVLGKQITR